MDDGVFQLLKNQDPQKLQQKSLSANLSALPLYEVENLFVHSESLTMRGTLARLPAGYPAVSALPRKKSADRHLCRAWSGTRNEQTDSPPRIEAERTDWHLSSSAAVFEGLGFSAIETHRRP